MNKALDATRARPSRRPSSRCASRCWRRWSNGGALAEVESRRGCGSCRPQGGCRCPTAPSSASWPDLPPQGARQGIARRTRPCSTRPGSAAGGAHRLLAAPEPTRSRALPSSQSRARGRARWWCRASRRGRGSRAWSPRRPSTTRGPRCARRASATCASRSSGGRTSSTISSPALRGAELREAAADRRSARSGRADHRRAGEDRLPGGHRAAARRRPGDRHHPLPRRRPSLRGGARPRSVAIA